MVEAWYARGKDNPDMIMLMALGEASIWAADELDLLGTVRLMLGMDVRRAAAQNHVETRL